MSTRGREFRRYELKFRLPRRQIPAIRAITAPHVKHDAHCAELPGKLYTVRSIYFDTEDLNFYFDKLDSVRVRKKLRIRTYNRSENQAPAFLEIKRKSGRLGFKERLMMELGHMDRALNGKEPRELFPELTYSERIVLEKFRFNLKTRRLRPVVLVAYEREAFQGLDNNRWRVTLDQNIRSLYRPELEQIFEETKLEPIEEQNFILELKFNDFMPRWMSRLICLLNLRPQSYSKYVHGINAWKSFPL